MEPDGARTIRNERAHSDRRLGRNVRPPPPGTLPRASGIEGWDPGGAGRFPQLARYGEARAVARYFVSGTPAQRRWMSIAVTSRTTPRRMKRPIWWM